MKVNSKSKVISIILFLIYLVAMLYATLLDESGLKYNGLNLTLFNTINNYIDVNGYQVAFKDVIKNLAGNIVLFMPLGYYLKIIYNKGLAYAMSWGLFLSIGIELTQFMLKIGACDVDDILLNLIGAILGSLIGILLSHLGKTVNIVIMILGTIVMISLILIV